MNKKMTTVFPTYIQGRRINVPVADRVECSFSNECEYFNPNSVKCYKPQSRKCGIKLLQSMTREELKELEDIL